MNERKKLLKHMDEKGWVIITSDNDPSRTAMVPAWAVANDPSCVEDIKYVLNRDTVPKEIVQEQVDEWIATGVLGG